MLLGDDGAALLLTCADGAPASTPSLAIKPAKAPVDPTPAKAHRIVVPKPAPAMPEPVVMPKPTPIVVPQPSPAAAPKAPVAPLPAEDMWP